MLNSIVTSRVVFLAQVTHAASADNILFARWQMGLSLAFHIVFAVIGIGMPLLMVIAEAQWLRTKNQVYRNLAEHWAKGTAVFFAIGAVSGTAISFELGLLWPTFMEHAGAIIGFPFSLEGFAFFSEAIFLGIYFYAWDRISERAHLISGIIVWVSGTTSAFFICMANAWMNSPTGFVYHAADHTFTNIDPIAAMFNPAWKSEGLHMVVAALMATAFGSAGIHAINLLRNPQNQLHRKALAITMTVGTIFALIQPITGDYAARIVAVHQPIKLAAMEGQFKTETHAPLRIGGIPIPSEGETKFAIDIPGMLSWLSYGSFDAEVKGINDFPADERPPVPVVHYAFQLMVGLGTILILAGLWFAFAAWRTHGLPMGRRLLKTLVWCAPLGFIAIEAGWTVTEVGRQPWIIFGVMRTGDAVTPMPNLFIPFALFTVLYITLSILVTIVVARQIKTVEDEGSAGHP